MRQAIPYGFLAQGQMSAAGSPQHNTWPWAAEKGARQPHMVWGLSGWLGAIDARNTRLHSAQLNNSHTVAVGLVGLRSRLFAGVQRGNVTLLGAGTGRVSKFAHSPLRDADWAKNRSGLPTSHAVGRGEWGALTHAIVRPHWVSVPAWAVLGPPRYTAGQNRDAFRRNQPAMRVISLMQALQASKASVAQQPLLAGG